LGVLEVLADRARLQAAQELLPVDPSRAQVLDRLVRLAADLVAAPMATLTIVEKDRQVFAAQVGLPEALAVESTPIHFSICRRDPLLRDHPAVVSLGVAAYVGVPLVTFHEHPVGTLCVVDVAPREWSDAHVRQLGLLADVAMDQFQLQIYAREASLRQAWKGVPELSRW
jgi:GAF domain-containing protein